MFTKSRMNIIIGILIFMILCVGLVGLANSGTLVKEKKYVQLEKPDNYITFNMKTQRVFIHWGTVGAVYQGDFKETDTDFSVFLDKSLEHVIYTKFDNGTISLAPDYPQYFTYEKGTFLNQLGL